MTSKIADSSVNEKGFNLSCSKCERSDHVTYEIKGGRVYICCSLCSSRINLNQIIPVTSNEKTALGLCKLHHIGAEVTGLRISGITLLNALSYGGRTFAEIEELYSGGSEELVRTYKFVTDIVLASNKTSKVNVFAIVKESKCPKTVSLSSYGVMLNEKLKKNIDFKFPLGFLQRVSRELTAKHSMSFNLLALIDAVGLKEATYSKLADDFGGIENSYDTVTSLIRFANKKHARKIFLKKNASCLSLEASGIHVQTSSPLLKMVYLTDYGREVYGDIQKIYSECQRNEKEVG